MKRYKLLTTKGYSSSFVIGKVYGENEKSIIGLPIKDYVKDYPADWQLVEEKQSVRHIDEHYKDWCGEHHTVNSCRPVHDSAEACDFAEYYHKQLIEEKQEKRPIMTYIILSVMMALYLYAGLWQINWPLIPATIMGFYLLFKIERNGRSN
jgi:hypothetical protein